MGRRACAGIAVALFGVEVLIALVAHDRFVRPYLGDVLAVMGVHFALRAATPIRPAPAAVTAFLIGCMIEGAQGIHLLDRLGLGHVTLLRIVLGSQFEWNDILAYGAGALAALGIERAFRRD